MVKRVKAGGNSHVFSGKTYPHPQSIRANANGLEIDYAPQSTQGYQWEWDWAGGAYEHPHDPELIVGIEGLNVSETRTADYSDYAFTGDWDGGGKNLRATSAHGNPFTFFKISGGNAVITFVSNPTVWFEDGGVLGITVNGSHYGIFGPTGSQWTGTGNSRSSSLNGKDYLSVGLLPDGLTTDAARLQALAMFRAHAYAFVTNTRITWNYDEASGFLTTVFTSTTVPKEGTETNTLQAQYRHQWLFSQAPLTPYTYSSARGTMKLLTGNTFSTHMPFQGILPVFPDRGYNTGTLNGYINDELGRGISGDIYNMGKAYGRAALLVAIADQTGNTSAKNQLLDKIKGRLQNWLTAEAGETNEVLYYNDEWDCLFGYPTAHYHETEINDHHFHYGYYIMAAAAVAQFDPAWASSWGGMVEMMIKDAANWDESDTRFPKLRNFDPYAGHCWAHGSAYYGRGNNQESSSESMNFNTATYLWGLHTGNKTIRDLGIYLWTTEAVAIEQYWFDVDNVVFPPDYPNPCAGQVFSNGVSYNTFFGSFANHVHAINFLPLTPGSTYLGRYPEYIRGNIDHMYNFPYGGQGRTGTWDDVVWGTLALADPAAGAARFGNFGGYGAFDGESKAHIYHMVSNLVDLGRPVQNVTADIPSFTVFDKAGSRTHIAYNPDNTDRTVTFSDGVSITVAAKSIASQSVSISDYSIRAGGARQAVTLMVLNGKLQALDRNFKIDGSLGAAGSPGIYFSVPGGN